MFWCSIKYVNQIKQNLNPEDAIELCENTIGSMDMKSIMEQMTSMGIISDKHMDKETKEMMSNPKKLTQDLKEMLQSRNREKNKQNISNEMSEKDVRDHFS